MGRLVCRLQITNADVLNYSYVKCDESGIEITKQFDNEAAMSTGLKNIQEQLAYLSENSLYIASACNKLVKKSLALALPFEEGKTSEDIEWCAWLMMNASSFDFVCENFYFYRQRGDSITHSISKKNCFDLTNNINLPLFLQFKRLHQSARKNALKSCSHTGKFFAIMAQAKK